MFVRKLCTFQGTIAGRPAQRHTDRGDVSISSAQRLMGELTRRLILINWDCLPYGVVGIPTTRQKAQGGFHGGRIK